MKSIQGHHKSGRNQQGLTLVEMMVAMTIGMVLLGGVITVLISSKMTYRVNEAVARMQENARFAFQLLSRDLRMAGYRGCVGNNEDVNNLLSTKTGFLWKLDQSLEGFEATSASGWTPALPAEVTSPLADRDVIVVRGVEGSHASVLSQASSSADLKVTDTPDSNFQNGDTVLASNCEGAVIFQVTGASSASGQVTLEHSGGSNSTADLGRAFTGGEVVRVSTRSYYIRTNPRGIPALYWKKGNLPAEELVEGVENMQIRYGEDSNEDRAADIYQTADLVVNWDNVVSVRIELLVQSVEDGIASQPQTYTFKGNVKTPSDRRLRQTFSTVISLRNRTS